MLVRTFITICFVHMLVRPFVAICVVHMLVGPLVVICVAPMLVGPFIAISGLCAGHMLVEQLVASMLLIHEHL